MKEQTKKMISMKCPNCNATLNLDIQNLGMYCQFCGGRLLFDLDTVNEILKAREETERVRIQEDGKTRREEIKSKEKTDLLEMKNRARIEKMEQERKKNKQDFPLMVLLVFLICFVMFLMFKYR